MTVAGGGLGRVGRHTLVYTAGILLNRAVSILLLPLYTRLLTPADYGVLQLIGMSMDIMAIVAGARMSAGIFYYYHRAESEGDRRALISTAEQLLAGTYAMAGIGTLLLAVPVSQIVFQTSAYAPLVQIAAVAFLFDGLGIVPLAFIQVRERSTQFVVITAGKLVVQVTLNVVLLVGFDMGVKGILISTLTANTLMGLGLGGYIFRAAGWRWSGLAARQLARFGIPLVGTQLATFIATFGDRYFLQSAGGEAEVGLYSLAYQFGFLLVLVGFMPFNTIWEPTRFGLAKRPDRDTLYSRGFLLCNLVLITALVGMVLFARDAVRIIAPPAYHSAADLVPILGVAYVLQCWSDFHNLGIMMRERTEWITAVNWVCAGVAVLGYVLLIPPYLGYGAAWATVIAFALRELFTYILSQRLWPVRYRWAPVLRLLGIAAVVIGASLALPSMSVPLSLAVRLVLLGVFCMGVWSGAILEDDHKAVLRQALKTPRAALALFGRS